MEILELDDLEIKIEFGQLELNMLYMRFAPPSRIKEITNHFHSSYELHFIPYGQGLLRTKDQSYTINAGDFYLTGPNVYHAQKGHHDNPMAEYCVNFEIIGEKIKENQGSKDQEVISKTLKETTFWYGKDKFNSMDLFKKIAEESHYKYVGYMENIKNYLQQILLNCIRSYLEYPYSLDQPPIKSKDDQRRQITDTYLHRFKEEVSVEELAKILGLSERHTRRFFHSIYGMSLHEKVKEMRIDLAKELLMNTRMTISRIGDYVGYIDPLYFSRVFKKSTGCSPTVYRRHSYE
ncbi:AraC family transcriptional regulator [Vallitalea okinawensis]|uniref:AraC family transcriptional regulator n=1 Tax=Vallitalea okinawensis TaxID=2078660 RepID=UPI0014780EF7|nr:AraC family transcriptional regulator [Vallitalea okinawensis]